MLVLSRAEGQSLVLIDDAAPQDRIIVNVVEVRRTKARLGIYCPRRFAIRSAGHTQPPPPKPGFGDPAAYSRLVISVELDRRAWITTDAGEVTLLMADLRLLSGAGPTARIGIDAPARIQIYRDEYLRQGQPPRPAIAV